MKSVHADNIVVTGGTAPYGDSAGNVRSRPLDFLRTMLCLRPDLSGPTCNTPTNFDVLAHHPINTAGGPDEGRSQPRRRLDRRLQARPPSAARRRARRHGAGRTAPALGHRGLVGEQSAGRLPRPVARHPGQFSSRPSTCSGSRAHRRCSTSRFATSPTTLEHPLATIQSGIYLRDWTPKPSAQAFAFPFVTERRSKTKVFAWGKSPEAGTLRIQRSAGGKWRKVDKLSVQAGEMFTDKLALKRKVQAPGEGQRTDELDMAPEGIGLPVRKVGSARTQELCQRSADVCVCTAESVPVRAT